MLWPQPRFSEELREAIRGFLVEADIASCAIDYAKRHRLDFEQLQALKRLCFFLNKLELYAQ